MRFIDSVSEFAKKLLHLGEDVVPCKIEYDMTIVYFPNPFVDRDSSLSTMKALATCGARVVFHEAGVVGETITNPYPELPEFYSVAPGLSSRHLLRGRVVFWITNTSFDVCNPAGANLVVYEDVAQCETNVLPCPTKVLQKYDIIIQSKRFSTLPLTERAHEYLKIIEQTPDRKPPLY